MVDPMGIDVMVIYLPTSHNRKGKREAKVIKQTKKQEEDLHSERISLGSTFLPKKLSEISKKATAIIQSLGKRGNFYKRESKKCFGSE